MDSNGELSVNFETEVTNFKKPDSELANPRICLALRDKYRPNEWDIVQMSMRRFDSQLWSSKDGMTNDPQDWCGKAFDQEGEEINDWIKDKVDLPYDANKGTLRAKFSRKFIGSTKEDMTLMAEREYQYMIIYGVFTNDKYSYKFGSKTSQIVGEKGKSVSLKLSEAQFDGSSILKINLLTALIAFLIY